MSTLQFDAAYREHRGAVLRYVVNRCGGVDPDDALQETFLQAWLSWDKRRVANIRGWLIIIARNVLSHMRRALSRRPEGREIVQWSSLTDDRSVPADQEFVAELRQVRGLISTLPPVQAAVLTGIADGYRPDEVAEMRGASAASVRGALTEARRKLRVVSTR